MKQTFEPTPAPTHQPQGHDQPPTRLSECGDTLGIREVCGVLGISARELRRLRQHGAFVEPVPHLHRRWTKQAIQRFMDGQARPTIRFGNQQRAGSR